MRAKQIIESKINLESKTAHRKLKQTIGARARLINNLEQNKSITADQTMDEKLTD